MRTCRDTQPQRAAQDQYLVAALHHFSPNSSLLMSRCDGISDFRVSKRSSYP